MNDKINYFDSFLESVKLHIDEKLYTKYKQLSLDEIKQFQLRKIRLDLYGPRMQPHFMVMPYKKLSKLVFLLIVIKISSIPEKFKEHYNIDVAKEGFTNKAEFFNFIKFAIASYNRKQYEVEQLIFKLKKTYEPDIIIKQLYDEYLLIEPIYKEYAKILQKESA